MSKLSKYIDITANVLIIVVALLFIGILVQRYFFPNLGNSERITPTIGKHLNLPDETFAAQSKTIVLALQTTCHFCNESAPFYKRLVKITNEKNIKIVAIFPQSVEESTEHLNQLGVTGIEVRQSPLSVVYTSGTPTLILVNKKGEVLDFWVGKLTPDKEVEVINQINSL
jgi:thiol-disulfide isomerase/thioredoxin